MKKRKIFAFIMICAIIASTLMSPCIILAENNLNVNNGAGAFTFIIDAGHGGEDGGASGLNGTLEKELNLSMALILNDLLTVLGYKTLMTRTGDFMLGDGKSGSHKLSDLRARLDMANDCENGIFVSIHMNKFPLSYCKGSTIYYSPNNPLSERIGNEIKSKITGSLQSDNTREMKAATSAIYILNRITIPAVLVECGFLSNEEESILLTDDGYRHKLACVIAAALTEGKWCSGG